MVFGGGWLGLSVIGILFCPCRLLWAFCLVSTCYRNGGIIIVVAVAFLSGREGKKGDKIYLCGLGLVRCGEEDGGCDGCINS